MQGAIKKKNQMMSFIQESVEKDIDQYRKAVENQYTEEQQRLNKQIEAEGKIDQQGTDDMAKIVEDYAKTNVMVFELLEINLL